MIDNPSELWQVYNEQGEALSHSGLPLDDATRGALHGSAHVWLWRQKNGRLELMLQKRADTVGTWPGFYDVSAAGHLNFGEKPVAAAIRETQEEIGVELEPAALRLLTVARATLFAPHSDIIENEVQFVFAVHAGDLAIAFAPDEVSATKWVTEDELLEIAAGSRPEHVVPHGKAYFTMVLERLHTYLEA